MTKGYISKLSPEDRKRVTEADRFARALKRDEEFFDHLKAIGFYPHTGQRDLFKITQNENIKDISLLCSRNFGKSTMCAIDTILKAGRYPNRREYILAPFRSQAYEIYWASNLLEAIVPPTWFAKGDDKINKQELRIRLNNGSFIKLDGADNETTARGYKPTGLKVDEAQDWKEDVYQAMHPNLLAHRAQVVKIWTPPPTENWIIRDLSYIQKRIAEGSPRYHFAHKTIYDNPRYLPEDIEELRKGFYERGEEHIWLREYMAQIIYGGKGAVFPMLEDRRHVRPISWIVDQLKRDWKRLNFYTISDPSGTRHATLFVAHNPTTGHVYVLDELVETDAKKNSCTQLKPRILEKESHSFGRPWEEPIRIYDEAALLWALEMTQLGVSYAPTKKKQNDKSNNISLVRDALVKDMLVVASHCKNLLNDMRGYRTNDKGRIIKEMDDCVDCLLYFYAESGYSFDVKAINLEPTEIRFGDEDRNYQRKEKSDSGDFFPNHEFSMDNEYLEDVNEELLWK